ncbi:hypothetical protein V6Z12_D02G157600 [Gossypium hirsutum]
MCRSSTSLSAISNPHRSDGDEMKGSSNDTMPEDPGRIVYDVGVMGSCCNIRGVAVRRVRLLRQRRLLGFLFLANLGWYRVIGLG